MSAIAGLYRRDGRPVDRAELERMTARLAHRGPDAAGAWIQGPVGLGHRMLWTTPESHQERLPLASDSGDVAITADARIDNRDELIAALGLSDRRGVGLTDSELISCAYARWGEDSPKRLIGDFAFALWDKRRQFLFCARDHSGVKPFYYHLSDRIFVLGSEIKALFSLETVPRQLNQVRVADHLAGLFEDESITFFDAFCGFPLATALPCAPRTCELSRIVDWIPRARLGCGRMKSMPRRSPSASRRRCGAVCGVPSRWAAC